MPPTAEALVTLSAEYRDDGSLFFATGQNMNDLQFPLVTLEDNGDMVTPSVCGRGGRYLTMDADGDRIVTVAHNSCSTGLGVRESMGAYKRMTDPKCGNGHAAEDVALAVTPDRVLYSD
jgi:hypothetical protein